MDVQFRKTSEEIALEVRSAVLRDYPSSFEISNAWDAYKEGQESVQEVVDLEIRRFKSLLKAVVDSKKSLEEVKAIKKKKEEFGELTKFSGLEERPKGVADMAQAINMDFDLATINFCGEKMEVERHTDVELERDKFCDDYAFLFADHVGYFQRIEELKARITSLISFMETKLASINCEAVEQFNTNSLPVFYSQMEVNDFVRVVNENKKVLRKVNSYKYIVLRLGVLEEKIALLKGMVLGRYGKVVSGFESAEVLYDEIQELLAS